MYVHVSACVYIGGNGKSGSEEGAILSLPYRGDYQSGMRLCGINRLDERDAVVKNPHRPP